MSGIEIDRSEPLVRTPQEIYDKMRSTCAQLDQGGVDLILGLARTHHTWSDAPVSEEDLKAIYALTRNGPTSTNTCPGRFVFVVSSEGKKLLSSCVNPGNRDKVLSAPALVIAAYDPTFWTFMPKLFPHVDRRSAFENDTLLAENTAFRNATLQAAYLMISARALGFDVGAMSGFSGPEVDAAFLAEKQWKSNFIISIGRADASGLMPKLPRLSFEEACSFV